jgi:glyoxylase-like metal-dependent hydrolase (beta-lactamase superfamily II)
VNITPRALFENLGSAEPLLVLDVRNEEDSRRWPVEGPRAAETLSIPYFDFIEREDESIDRVRTWIAGRSRPVAVVCAKGGSSEYVAGILRDRGLDARNLEGGMGAWGSEVVWRPLPPSASVRVWQVNRFGKGCLSYVVAGSQDAIVVDPHRRVDEYRGLLEQQGLTLRGVFDTHLHADHVSGGPALAAAAGVPYYVNAADFEGAQVTHEVVEDGRKLDLAGVPVVPLCFRHAPGHTPGSTVLVAGESVLLTGDTLFVGSVGRPDLGGKAGEWGRDLFVTLHQRLAPLSDELSVLPAHSSGPGEMSPAGVVSARLGDLRHENPSMSLDEAEFLRRIEDGTGSAPSHYATLRRINLGVATASAEQLDELEIGRNECALSRRER